jgi:hypothetical protein
VPAPESSSELGFGRRSGPRNVAAEPAGAFPVAGAQQGAASQHVRAPPRCHAERQGRSRRTRTLPPICAAAATFAIIGSDAQNRLFCRFVRLRGVSAAWSRAAGRKGEFGP